jgi:hypothetical protein
MIKQVALNKSSLLLKIQKLHTKLTTKLKWKVFRKTLKKTKQRGFGLIDRGFNEE